MSIDRTDNDEDFLYLFLDDVYGCIEKTNGIKYLVLDSTDKNKEALKYYKKLWEETKTQIKVINNGSNKWWWTYRIQKRLHEN